MAKRRRFADLAADPRIPELLVGLHRAGVKGYMRLDADGNPKRYAAREVLARELPCCPGVADTILKLQALPQLPKPRSRRRSIDSVAY